MAEKVELLGIEEGASVTPSGPGGQPCAALYKGDLRNDSFIAANGLHRPLNLATCFLYICQGATSNKVFLGLVFPSFNLGQEVA